MRTVGFVIIVGLLAAPVALAQAPAGLAPPPHAFVYCKISADGLVSGCEAMSEAPAGRGLGDLAVKWMNGVKSAPQPGLKKGATVGSLVGVCFDSSGAAPAVSDVAAACPVAPAAYSMDDVISRPTDAQFRSAWPERVRDATVGGEVSLSCAVDGAGRLHGCSVGHESPPGESFGLAALKLAPLYGVRPKLVDGTGRAGTIALTVTFDRTILLRR